MNGLMIAGLIVSCAAFIVNLIYCIKNGVQYYADPIYGYLQYGLMFFVTVALFVIIVSILISSYYEVTDKYFITCFGLIKSKYAIADVEEITLDRNTNKLSVTFANSTFIVIVVKEEWYNDFVSAIIAVNPKIEYSIISEDKDQKKK
jgi:hypothetical protein